MESIKGKNAIITGAGKGIGRAIAIALAQEGVNVGLLARTLSDLEKVAEELKQYEVKVLDIPLHSTPRFRYKVRHPFRSKVHQYSGAKVTNYSAAKYATLLKDKCL